MKNPVIRLVGLLVVLCLTVSVAAAAGPAIETKAEQDARMQWWREARFGLFIHWGLYAVPAGEWGGKTIYGEWIRNNAQIPLPTYDKFVAQFNPVKFDAAAWARMAKDAGMKYIVITSKHHDGFAIFDSKVSDFDVMATPFKRDILKELAEACRKRPSSATSSRSWPRPAVRKGSSSASTIRSWTGTTPTTCRGGLGRSRTGPRRAPTTIAT
jgi:hypothetical protein